MNPTYPRLILLQGPPNSGKDTAAAHLAAVGYYQKKFAAPIVNFIRDFFPLAEELAFNELKPRLASDLGYPKAGPNYTIRDLMIAFSERLVKPTLGSDAFGLQLAASLKTWGGANGLPPPVVISDSGFPAEAEPLFALYGLHRCLIIQLKRTGTTFERDSRSYWLKEAGFHITLHNNSTKEDLHTQLDNALRSFADFFPPRT